MRKSRSSLCRYQRSSPISLAEVERKLIKEVFWKIPNDYPTTMAAIDQGKVLFEVGQGKEICKSFTNLASFFLGIGQPEKEKNRREKVRQESRGKWRQLKLRPLFKPGI